VTIETSAEVKKICVTDANVTGVRTANGTYSADIVISNADYAFTETHLLDRKYQSYPESYWKKKTIAPSAFLIYLGVKGKIKNVSHHTLSFANNWQDHFEEIFKNPKWPNKPSYYVCCPSKTDPTVAPKNHENLFILVPVAAGISDTDTQRSRYAAKIIKDFEKLIGESISDRIVTQRIFSQRDFMSEYNAHNGTALGLAHTLTQTAHLRPSITSKKVKNLFYVGQYTQPGIGMPMCLIAAELVSKEVDPHA
jgi:phytoene desaturase